MRMLVIHDELGNVKSAAIAPARTKAVAGLRPRSGEFVIELEVTVVEPEELRRNPGLLSENFCVDTVNHRLTPKR